MVLKVYEEQSEFRAGRSCIDNIFCLKQINEMKNATNQEVDITFINIQKVYHKEIVRNLSRIQNG